MCAARRLQTQRYNILKPIAMKPLIATTLFIAAMFAGQSLTAQTGERFLKVKGEAIIKTTPEDMVIRIPIEVKDKEYKATSDKLIKTYNDLMDALAKAGLDRDTLKSTALHITEDYNYVERERVLVGYVGRIQMLIEMNHDTEMLRRIMDTLADEQFKFGYNLSFKLSKTQEDNLLEEAIQKATVDAVRKADILASALEVTLQEIKEINFDYDMGGGAIPVYRDVMMMSKTEADTQSGGLQLNPQEIELRKEVRVIWVIAGA